MGRFVFFDYGRCENPMVKSEQEKFFCTSSAAGLPQTGFPKPDSRKHGRRKAWKQKERQVIWTEIRLYMTPG